MQQALSHVGKFDGGRRFVRAEDGGKDVFLGGQGVQHALFDGVFGDEVDDLYGGGLTVTMGAGDALFEHGGIPGQVEVDDERGGLQVEPDAARVGRKEDAAVRIVEEFLDERAAFGRGDIARQFDVTEADALEDGFGECQHVRPLAEDDGFVSVAGDFFGEDFIEFGQFGRGLFAVVGLDVFVVQGKGIADEAHFDQTHQQDFMFLGRERPLLGFGEQFGDGLLKLAVGFPLRVGHLDEEVVVHALGQVFEDFVAGAAQDMRLDEGTQLVHVFVAENLVRAALASLEFVKAVVEVPQGSQNARVEELEDAVEFVNAVFERRACQNEGIAARQGLDHHGSLGAPVLDALGFVEDDEVGAQFEQFVQVVADEFVVDDFEEGGLTVEVTAGSQIAFDYDNGEGSETANLARPLMLQGSRADDQGGLDVAQFFEERGGCDGLHGFTKAHVVCQHGTAAKSQVHGAFFLVGVEFGGQHVESAASAFDLFEEPFFLPRHFFAVLQQGKVFVNRFGHTDEGTLAGRQGFDLR